MFKYKESLKGNNRCNNEDSYRHEKFGKAEASVSPICLSVPGGASLHVYSKDTKTLERNEKHLTITFQMKKRIQRVNGENADLAEEKR